VNYELNFLSLYRFCYIAFKVAKMLKTTLLTLGVSLVILLIAVMAMAFRPLFLKKRFPNIHIGGNKALKERGISCATSQDREAQNQAKKHNYKYKTDNK
jgi:hypothetical protein